MKDNKIKVNNKYKHNKINKNRKKRKKGRCRVNKVRLFLVSIIIWVVISIIVFTVISTYKSFTKNKLDSLSKIKIETSSKKDTSNTPSLPDSVTSKQFNLEDEKDTVIDNIDDETDDINNKTKVKDDNLEKKTNVVNNTNKKTVKAIEENDKKSLPTVINNFKSKVIKRSNTNDNEDLGILSIFSRTKNIEQVKLPYTNETDRVYTVFIDPCFGGSENGVTSKNKVKAKDITLDIAKEVNRILSKFDDIKVVMSRTEDKRLSETERIGLVNTSDADLMVSIRVNAQSSDFTATGIETYYSRDNFNSKESYSLAEIVQKSTVNFTNAKKRNVLSTKYPLLTSSNVPSTIVQVGYLTTESEEKKLIDKEYQRKLAEGIAQGILNYIDRH